MQETSVPPSCSFPPFMEVGWNKFFVICTVYKILYMVISQVDHTDKMYLPFKTRRRACLRFYIERLLWLLVVFLLLARESLFFFSCQHRKSRSLFCGLMLFYSDYNFFTFCFPLVYVGWIHSVWTVNSITLLMESTINTVIRTFLSSINFAESERHWTARSSTSLYECLNAFKGNIFSFPAFKHLFVFFPPFVTNCS